MFSKMIHPLEGNEDMMMQLHSDGSNHSSHIGDTCVVLTSDPKPRLRWTSDLHNRFVDAVTQLGGATSKFICSLFSHKNGKKTYIQHVNT
ncbi:putative transcription factor MYB-HB-like family [Lupinus albus]|uniref:Putative transcription factor MYB-HB-like family n=1 Tax=Lupinus albus TaxID=3870 RepID=A0A6A4QEB4_LUPAL|nr:putative transcription factor MYB-HB-like family [Lupinus albus]